jgi:hypothetical protein
MDKTIRAGKGIWVRYAAYGNRIIAACKQDEHPGKGWHPLYSKSRVKGNEYLPYAGVTDWEREANYCMALLARG